MGSFLSLGKGLSKTAKWIIGGFFAVTVITLIVVLVSRSSQISFAKFSRAALKIYNEETASRVSPSGSSSSSSSTIAISKCADTDSFLELEMDRDVQVLVCTNYLSHGGIGVVFEGLLQCSLSEADCESRFGTLPGSTEVTLAAGSVTGSFPTVNGVRKVAVKYVTKDAVEGKIKNQHGNVLLGDITEETENLKLYQDSDFFVKYLGTLPEVVSDILAGRGLVMEFVEGETLQQKCIQTDSEGLAVINNGKAVTKCSNEMINCYAAQTALVFGFEVSKGRIDTDMHFRNVMVPAAGDKFRLNENTTCEKIKVIDVGLTANVTTVREATEPLLVRTLLNYYHVPQVELQDVFLGLVKRFVKAGSKQARAVFTEQNVEALGRMDKLTESTIAAAKKAIRLIRA